MSVSSVAGLAALRAGAARRAAVIAACSHFIWSPAEGPREYRCDGCGIVRRLR